MKKLIKFLIRYENLKSSKNLKKIKGVLKNLENFLINMKKDLIKKNIIKRLN